jgi:hypothetical protein
LTNTADSLDTTKGGVNVIASAFMPSHISKIINIESNIADFLISKAPFQEIGLYRYNSK